MSKHSLRVTLGQHSRAGRKPLNQDFHGARVPAEPLLSTKGIVVALADGIGSSPVSQLASAAAVRGFLEDYPCTSEAWTVHRAAQCVLQAINAWLYAQDQHSEARFNRDRGHVCTFSALVLKGRQAHLLHVGDARVYRVHPQALEQLSEDHRIHLSSAESYLSRALGAAPHVEFDHRSWPLECGELYLLATDGVHEWVDATHVQAALAAHPHHLDDAASALADAAYQRGSPDNLTVQLLRVDALPDEGLLQRLGEREDLALHGPLQPRASFEGYTVLRELHASARSHVYLAQDQASGAHAVLKLPAVELSQNPEALDRFQLEEWVARRMDSAHVLKPHPVVRPRQHLFVAMEFIDGHTLAQWMADHPRPTLDEVRQVIDQLAKGLQAFHRKDMLHQDLRPENVMIDRSGTVRIIDFASVHVAGLAERMPDPAARDILGTLQYTAPEYFTGQGGSERSELFALAVLTYQMLSGQLPYGLQAARVRTPADVARLRFTPVRQHRPDLPRWLDAVLGKALATDPARRHESVGEFAHALHHPNHADAAWRPPTLIERNPVAFWQTVSALLLLLVLLLVAERIRP
jgi:serine/threonine protein phosphatase PrpC